jgi:hypothetical protein
MFNGYAADEFLVATTSCGFAPGISWHLRMNFVEPHHGS